MLHNITDFFTNNHTTFIIAVGFLSLLIGSFLNVVIYRLPNILFSQWKAQCYEYLDIKTKKTAAKSLSLWGLAIPRSHCTRCNKVISAYDNIPVFSYLFLRGRCRNCKTKISWQYPLVELLSCILSIVVAYKYGLSAHTFLGCLLTYVLLAQAAIDIHHKIIPDEITLLFLWIGLYFSLNIGFVDSSDAILGAIIGYLSLWSIYWLFYLTTGKEGMGYGDFKLLAMLGAWLGWQMLPIVIIFSSLFGAVVGIAMLALRYTKRETQIPFGPFIAIGGWIALMWGERINHWYWQINGLNL